MGNLKGVCLPGTFSDSKQALLKWHLSLSLSLSPPPLNGSFVRGTWREGSYTEDSHRRGMEGYENGASLLDGSIRGT